MTAFVVIDEETGDIAWSGQVREEAVGDQVLKPGQRLVVVEEYISSSNRLDLTTGEFVPSEKKLAVAAAREARLVLEQTFTRSISCPFSFNGRLYDVDRMRMVEVALVGGNLLCFEKTSW